MLTEQQLVSMKKAEAHLAEAHELISKAHLPVMVSGSGELTDSLSTALEALRQILRNRPRR